jgi:AcrR family transcriptional regulator
MARQKEFDIDAAVEAAVEVFREHGFEGTSARMLVDAMGIGRQSLYDTFGDKWGIYCAALERYCRNECRAHVEALASADRSIDGVRAMLARVVASASDGCLGLGSIVEFGRTQTDLTKIREPFGKHLHEAVMAALVDARAQGDVGAELDLDQLAAFLLHTVAVIRIAARSGTEPEHVAAIAELALRALR